MTVRRAFAHVALLSAVFAGTAAGQDAAQRLPGGRVGTTYRVMIPASGGARPYSFSVAEGAIPAGLSLDVATGEIEGTFADAGEYVFTVQVEDAESAVARQEVVMRVEPLLTEIPPLELRTASLPAAGVDRPYRVNLAAEGGMAPYKWRVRGKMPPGLVLKPEGEIAGTPKQAGTTELEIKVSDSQGNPAEAGASLELEVVSHKALDEWWRYVGLALIVVGYVVMKQGVNDRHFFHQRDEMKDRGLVLVLKKDGMILQGPESVKNEYRKLMVEDSARVALLRLVALGSTALFLYYVFWK